LAGLGLGQNGIDATPVESRISRGHLSRDQPWGSAERYLLRCHCDDADRQDFLKTLAETCQKAGFQIRACCLIDGQGSDKMRRLVEKLWFDPFLCGCWFSATVLGLTVEQWIKCCLTRHCLYEQRDDRKNYYQLLITGSALA
jgi:hypothetical protein